MGLLKTCTRCKVEKPRTADAYLGEHVATT